MTGEDISKNILDELVTSVSENTGKDISDELIIDLLSAAWEHQYDPNQEKLNQKFTKILKQHDHKI